MMLQCGTFVNKLRIKIFITLIRLKIFNNCLIGLGSTILRNVRVENDCTLLLREVFF